MDEQRQCQPDQTRHGPRNSFAAHYFACDRNSRAPFGLVAMPGRDASEREDGEPLSPGGLVVADMVPLCYTVDGFTVQNQNLEPGTLNPEPREVLA